MAQRTPADIRDSPESTGDCDWVDVLNNWRDADATWLQERSVVRVATTPDAETALANVNEGRVFYSVSEKGLLISTNGAAPFPKVLSSEKLLIDESVPGHITVGISGHESGGITFDTATGAVTIGSLTLTSISGTTLVVSSVTTGALTVNASGGITINTDGSHTTILTTGALGLLINSSISVTGFVRGAGAEFTSLSVTGDSSFGNVTFNGSIIAATAVVTPLLEASAGNDLTINSRAGKAIRFTAPTIPDADFYYGAGTTIRLAWVVVSNTDPGVLTVPEGTIWVNPSAN